MSAPTGFAAAVLPLRAVARAEAMRLTRSAADADDLVQDSLVSAMLAWPRFRPPAGAEGPATRAWLLTIVRRKFLDAYRARQRRATLVESYGPHPDYYRASAAGADLDEAPRARCTAVWGGVAVPAGPIPSALAAAVGALDPRLRTVLERVADGVPLPEIAAELGVPSATVRSRAFRARARLRAAALAAAADYGIGRQSGRAREDAPPVEAPHGPQADRRGV